MKKNIYVLFYLCLLNFNSFGAEKNIPVNTLDNKWLMYGQGIKRVNNDLLFLKEKKRSKGLALISPEVFDKKIVLSFEVMPLTPLTVFNIMLAASDLEFDNTLIIPQNYDGSLKFWKNRTKCYLFSFGNSVKNDVPYLEKYPDKKRLITVDKNKLIPGMFNKIEIGKKRDKLWLSINDEELFEFDDDHELEEGKIVIHIHGAFNEQAACLVRNITVRKRK